MNLNEQQSYFNNALKRVKEKGDYLEYVEFKNFRNLKDAPLKYLELCLMALKDRKCWGYSLNFVDLKVIKNIDNILSIYIDMCSDSIKLNAFNISLINNNFLIEKTNCYEEFLKILLKFIKQAINKDPFALGFLDFKELKNIPNFTQLYVSFCKEALNLNGNAISEIKIKFLLPKGATEKQLQQAYFEMVQLAFNSEGIEVLENVDFDFLKTMSGKRDIINFLKGRDKVLKLITPEQIQAAKLKYKLRLKEKKLQEKLQKQNLKEQNKNNQRVQINENYEEKISNARIEVSFDKIDNNKNYNYQKENYNNKETFNLNNKEIYNSNINKENYNSNIKINNLKIEKNKNYYKNNKIINNTNNLTVNAVNCQCCKNEKENSKNLNNKNDKKSLNNQISIQLSFELF